MAFQRYYSRTAIALPEVLEPTTAALWVLWNFTDSGLVAKVRRIVIFNPTNAGATAVAPITLLHVVNFGMVSGFLRGAYSPLITGKRNEFIDTTKVCTTASAGGVTYGNILRQTVYDFDDRSYSASMANWFTLPATSELYSSYSSQIDPLTIRENEGCGVWLDPSTPIHESYGTFTKPNAGFIEVYAEVDIGT